jgi:hypothetical protein
MATESGLFDGGEVINNEPDRPLLFENRAANGRPFSFLPELPQVRELCRLAVFDKPHDTSFAKGEMSGLRFGFGGSGDV